MKTKLLTLMLLIVASVFYSCSKESDNDNSKSASGNTAITDSQRQIIISNCSSHSGCHSSSSRMATVVTLEEANTLLRSSINHSSALTICDRSKLQQWFNGEIVQ